MLFVLENFLTMEPLRPTDNKGESIPHQEEAAVASVRSAMKELQESVQELCKATLDKIAAIRQYLQG